MFTPDCSASARMVGSFSPGASSPEAMPQHDLVAYLHVNGQPAGKIQLQKHMPVPPSMTYLHYSV